MPVVELGGSEGPPEVHPGQVVQVVVALVAPVGVGQVLIVLGRAGRRLVRVDVPVAHAAVAEAEAHARRHLG